MNKLDIIGNSAAAVATGIQITYNGIYNIVSLICLGLTVVSIILSLISKCVSWYNKAKKDGKIDSEEVGALLETLEESSNALKDAAQSVKERANNE